METKFCILDEVFYLNTAMWKVESAKVVKATVVPTGMGKNEKGEDVLDGVAVFYELDNRMVISEEEAFASKAEVVEACKKVE